MPVVTGTPTIERRRGRDRWRPDGDRLRVRQCPKVSGPVAIVGEERRATAPPDALGVPLFAYRSLV
ncbi:MAG: hypothetical protein ACJ79K_02160 [Gemmatimonadaceae bacterium]